MDINSLKGFTPGPWKANHRIFPNGTPPEKRLACAVWTEEGFDPIATTRFSVGKYNEVPAEIQHNNCLLIAAAPDLLELARMGLELASGIEDELSEGLQHSSWLRKKARALREKAAKL